MRFVARRGKGWDVEWSTGKSTIWPVVSRITRAIYARTVVARSGERASTAGRTNKRVRRALGSEAVRFVICVTTFRSSVVRVSLVDSCFLKKFR